MDEMVKIVGWDYLMMMREKQIMDDDEVVLVIREYDVERDKLRVQEMERRCEVGPTPAEGQMSLFTDDLGDPICRIRHSPAFLMLVAEMEIGAEKEIVGLIRGCIKTVTCGKKLSRNGKIGNRNDTYINKFVPVYTKLAYILGLRVSSSHRRMGIGLKLVTRMEYWFRENGAEYSYMATEKDNEASVKLFTERCGYSKFRTPSILVQPVFAHRVRIPKRVKIFKLSTSDAEKLYYRRFSTTEFFPRDINSILNNRLNLGTFVAVPSGTYFTGSWPGSDQFLANPPESWTILSVWNTKEVFMLEVRGASRTRRALAKTTRLMDRAFPWLGIPSVPEVFRPFGSHFLYGLGGEGPESVKLMKALCGFAHNLAKECGCGVVATEVSGCEPLRLGIPHWKRLSCAEDLWCIKRLGEDYDGSVGDWTRSPPGTSIFVDPREV
ncbi:GNAT domain [Macleaya cordata]|uniref:GNAT domain n=1 Tax=Macleaya cordata TaxID=56857 RepID=A0A200QFW7_MACCD|nr:GNAT domain [Macleaya cordata]